MHNEFNITPLNTRNRNFMTEKEQAYIRSQNKKDLIKQLNHFNYTKYFPLNIELLSETLHYAYTVYSDSEFVVEEILNLILFADDSLLDEYFTKIQISGEILFHEKLNKHLLKNPIIFGNLIKNVKNLIFAEENIEFINKNYLDVHLVEPIEITNSLSLILAMADIINSGQLYEIKKELFLIEDKKRLWEFLSLLTLKSSNRNLIIKKINKVVDGDILNGNYGKYDETFINEWFLKFKSIFK